MSTKDKQAQLWANRGNEAVKGYWNNRSHIRRCRWFANHLLSYNISSVFEVGIMGGRNINIIKRNFKSNNKKCVFAGIDVGKASVEFAKEKMPDVHFEQQSVYDMDTDDKYDLVFSAGVFIHIPPDGIDVAIQKCIGKANRYVMHMEGLGEDDISKGPESFNPKKLGTRFQWRPDLVRRYEELGFEPQIIKLPHTNNTRDLSHLVIVNVEKNDGR